MRAAARKATNRELRRAFGSEAVDTIGEMVKTINRQGEAIVGIGEAVSKERTHRLELAKEQRDYVDGEDRRLTYRIAYLERLSCRGFFGRLKWLLLGR